MKTAFTPAMATLTYLRRIAAHVCILCAVATLAFSQSREHGSRGEHLIAVVPMIGAGTPSDPRRPMFVPNPNDVSAAMASGQPPSFLAIHFVMTDDGKNAIVEFVGKDRPALKQIIAAGKTGAVQVFDPHAASQADTAIQLRKLKADFDFNVLRGLPLSAVFTSAASAGGSK